MTLTLHPRPGATQNGVTVKGSIQHCKFNVDQLVSIESSIFKQEAVRSSTMVDSELVVSQSAEGKHLCATQDAVETAAKQMERVDSAMLLKSDIVIDVAKFEPSAISEQTAKLNKEVIQISASGPKWFEVGPAQYRQMRINGETPFPKPEPSPHALEINIPSREASRNIPCRLIYPICRNTSRKRKQCKGSVLHMHGGGWTLGDHTSADNLLQMYADSGDLAVLSVGYRLAPMHPYPAGPEDCIDIGEYLVKNSEREYGGPLRFIGGESAGSHLSLLLTFHLLKSQPTFKPSGLLLHYGCYDLTKLPSVRNFKQDPILDFVSLQKFTDHFLPGRSTEDMKNPSISPYYENLDLFRGKLPSVLFTSGTEDPLLDDSTGMYMKWRQAGGEAIIKFYPGARHGFIGSLDMLGEAGNALEDTKTYIRSAMGQLLMHSELKVELNKSIGAADKEVGDASTC